MEKSLSERIAEHVITKGQAGHALNRAAFLAARQEIERALQDGWSVKDIWATLHDEKKINFSYQAFRNYVNNLGLIDSSNKNDSKA